MSRRRRDSGRGRIGPSLRITVRCPECREPMPAARLQESVLALTHGVCVACNTTRTRARARN
jgi:hypothetical protein